MADDKPAGFVASSWDYMRVCIGLKHGTRILLTVDEDKREVTMREADGTVVTLPAGVSK
jgi:hypothetical protein